MFLLSVCSVNDIEWWAANSVASLALGQLEGKDGMWIGSLPSRNLWNKLPNSLSAPSVPECYALYLLKHMEHSSSEGQVCFALMVKILIWTVQSILALHSSPYLYIFGRLQSMKYRYSTEVYALPHWDPIQSSSLVSVTSELAQQCVVWAHNFV